MEEIAANIYVDDLISCGCKKEEVIELKEIVIKIFQRGGFKLHKWHTNCSIKSHEGDHEHQFSNQTLHEEQHFCKNA